MADHRAFRDQHVPIVCGLALPRTLFYECWDVLGRVPGEFIIGVNAPFDFNKRSGNVG